MKWFSMRRRLHIRTLNGHVFTVPESPRADLEVIMAEMISAMAAPEGVTVLVGEEGAAWIRANQIESLWISK